MSSKTFWRLSSRLELCAMPHNLHNLNATRCGAPRSSRTWPAVVPKDFIAFFCAPCLALNYLILWPAWAAARTWQTDSVSKDLPTFHFLVLLLVLLLLAAAKSQSQLPAMSIAGEWACLRCCPLPSYLISLWAYNSSSSSFPGEMGKLQNNNHEIKFVNKCEMRCVCFKCGSQRTL